MTIALVCWIAHRIVGIRRAGPYCVVAHPNGTPLKALNHERNLPVAVQSRLGTS